MKTNQMETLFRDFDEANIAPYELNFVCPTSRATEELLPTLFAKWVTLATLLPNTQIIVEFIPDDYVSLSEFEDSSPRLYEALTEFILHGNYENGYLVLNSNEGLWKSAKQY